MAICCEVAIRIADGKSDSSISAAIHCHVSLVFDCPIYYRAWDKCFLRPLQLKVFCGQFGSVPLAGSKWEPSEQAELVLLDSTNFGCRARKPNGRFRLKMGLQTWGAGGPETIQKLRQFIHSSPRQEETHLETLSTQWERPRDQGMDTEAPADVHPTGTGQ